MLRHERDAEPGQSQMLNVLLAVAHMAQLRRNLCRRAQLLQPRRDVAVAPAEQGRAVEGGKRDRVMRGKRVRRGESEPVALLEQGPAGEALRQSLALVEERGVDLALQQRLDERVLAGHLELQLERRDAPRELLQR